jgi:hypothetical protein
MHWPVVSILRKIQQLSDAFAFDDYETQKTKRTVTNSHVACRKWSHGDTLPRLLMEDMHLICSRHIYLLVARPTSSKDTNLKVYVTLSRKCQNTNAVSCLE